LINKITVIFIILFFLGACAETQLLVHTAKKIGQNNNKIGQQGRYKIGNPYKIKGVWYYPTIDYSYDKTGIASWYGPGFDGKMTANGETYDQNALTAAHKTLPLPSIVQVTNLENGRSIKVTINDRGPYAFGRIIDMSRRGAQLLDFRRKGIARVRVQVLAAESRLIAQRMKNGSLLAKIGTPIRQNIKFTKPSVRSKALAPPVGVKSIKINPQYQPRSTALLDSIRPSKKKLPPTNIISKEPISFTRMFVQAGAFTRFDFANKTAARLAELQNVKVTSYKVNGKEFFRVRVGPINAIGAADNILERVIIAGFTNARIVID
jgi:rare lipoprotein A